MLTLLTAAALSAAPAIQPPVSKAEAQASAAKGTEAPCDMPCCKGKKMPCCDKMAAEKKTAEAPAEGGHGAHEHDH